MDYRKIKEIMKDRKYTLEELSELSGIPLSTLSKITSGITPNPRYDTMAAIAQALNCSLDEFSETAPKISYTFKKYSSKFEALPSSIPATFIRYLPKGTELRILWLFPAMADSASILPSAS